MRLLEVAGCIFGAKVNVKLTPKTMKISSDDVSTSFSVEAVARVETAGGKEMYLDSTFTVRSFGNHSKPVFYINDDCIFGLVECTFDCGVNHVHMMSMETPIPVSPVPAPIPVLPAQVQPPDFFDDMHPLPLYDNTPVIDVEWQPLLDCLL